MSIRRPHFLVVAVALALGPLAFAQEPPQAAKETTLPKFPKFIMDALGSPHVLKAKIYVLRDGTIERSKVYVKREGIPDWAHAVADDKLGKGDDLAYEVEVYADGTEVFEIARLVGMKPKKVSIRRDRQVRYVETIVDKAAVPAAVAATLGRIDGFRAVEVHRREGENLTEFDVRGIMGGTPHRVMIRADGSLHALSRHVSAEMDVAVPSPEPAAK